MKNETIEMDTNKPLFKLFEIDGSDEDSIESKSPCSYMEDILNLDLNLFLLHQVIKNGWLKSVEDYFNSCPINDAIVKEKDKDGKNIIHFAAFGANEKVLTLLKSKLDPLFSELINERDYNGETPVFQAAVTDQYITKTPEKHLAIIQLLEQYGADIRIKNNRGQNLLHYAAKYNNIDLVEWLVNTKHFFIDEQDDGGSTPAMLAASFRGDLAMLLKLYKLNASFFIATNKQSQTVITELMFRDHKETLENLANLLSELTDYVGGNINELLAKAAERDAIHIMEWFNFSNKEKININYQNSEGKTALYRASATNSERAVRWLLDHYPDADPRIIANTTQFSPLGIAIHNNYYIVTGLLEKRQRQLKVKKGFSNKKKHPRVTSTPLSVNRNENTSLAVTRNSYSKIDEKMMAAVAKKDDLGYNKVRYYIQYKKANFNQLKPEEKNSLIAYAERTNKAEFLEFLKKNYPNDFTTVQTHLAQQDRKLLQAMDKKNDKGYRKAIYLIQYQKANFDLIFTEEKQVIKDYAENTNKKVFLEFLGKNYSSNFTTTQTHITQDDRKLLQAMNERSDKGYNKAIYFIRYKHPNLTLLDPEETQTLRVHAKSKNKTLDFVRTRRDIQLDGVTETYAFSSASTSSNFLFHRVLQGIQAGYRWVNNLGNENVPKTSESLIVDATSNQHTNQRYLRMYAKSENKTLDFVRTRRDIQLDGVTETYASSSASTSSNFLFHRVLQGIQAGYRWVNNLGNEGNVPKTSESLIVDATSNQHTNQRFQPAACQTDSVLSLLNLLIRCKTKVKYSPKIELNEDSQREVVASVHVAEVMSEFDQFIRKNTRATGLHYDTVIHCMQLPELQKKLSKALYHDPHVDIQSVFHRHIQGITLTSNTKQASRFLNKIEQFDIPLACGSVDVKKADLPLRLSTTSANFFKNIWDDPSSSQTVGITNKPSRLAHGTG